MKLIPLTHGKFAMVDDEDYEEVSKYKWMFWSSENGVRATIQCYALRNLHAHEEGYVQGKRKKIKLHRFILGVKDPSVWVDHEDNNGLNCQRSNLRLATASQNAKNTTSWGSSKYLGVSMHKVKYRNGNKKIWQANCNNKYIGVFETEEEAAKAYDLKALELHGEFANLNFKN